MLHALNPRAGHDNEPDVVVMYVENTGGGASVRGLLHLLASSDPSRGGSDARVLSVLRQDPRWRRVAPFVRVPAAMGVTSKRGGGGNKWYKLRRTVGGGARGRRDSSASPEY